MNHEMNHEQLLPPGMPPAEPPLPSQIAAVPGAERHEQASDRQPRIWVGSLTDYNNGVLHGRWLDAARAPDELQADIAAMLARSPWTARTGEPAEEWGIFDYDNFGNCQLDEYEDISWVSALATGIRKHGLAFAAWAKVIDEREHLNDFDAAYLGHYDDLHSYIEQLINDLGYERIIDRALPASIRPYVKIDITATANDLLLGGDLHTLPAAEGGVWIFRG